MKRHIYRITSFNKVRPFTLAVRFDDGTEQTIDFRSVLHGEIYRPLRDPTLFDAATLDPAVGTLVWPNGADFDPATLHDWPECGPELAHRAERWREAPKRKHDEALAVAEDRADYVTRKRKARS